MAGSQLKQLKEALKAKGLVGQTNVKRKNKKAAPSDTRKDYEERKKELARVRGDFNQFDNRINRAKHDYTIVQGGKFVKAGSKQHNDATRSHSRVEKAMKMDYEAEKRVKNRVGGVVDRRFGEKNSSMTEEEKMLERFTRERQGAKKNVFSLGSDDEYDDDEGFALTHSGKQLELEDFAESDLGVAQATYRDEDERPRKKSKKEVMAEIIAKSKFHKKQRQMEFQRTQDEIMDLDDDFADVMGEIRAGPAPATVPKLEQDREYDAKVRELTYDRRAVPAERTKTQEELEAEHTDKMKKLEEDRMKRMSGLQSEGGADELDDIWAGSSDEEDIEEEEEEEAEAAAVPSRRVAAVLMPATHEQLAQAVEGMDSTQTVAHIDKIAQAFHPRLAQGNKAKMDAFVALVFEHILHVGNRPHADSHLVNLLTHKLRGMAEQYNEALVQTIRAKMEAVEQRIVALLLEKQDLVFFVVLGYCFSASDHYHLVITPALILMNQFLNACIGSTLTAQQIGQGLVVCDTLLTYQFYAKRYDPEVVRFVEKAMNLLLPAASGVAASGLNVTATKLTATGPIEVLKLFEKIKPADLEQFKLQLLAKACSTIDKCVELWREKSALVEVLHTFETLLAHADKHLELEQVPGMLARFTKLGGNMQKSRKPLTLQEHRLLAIKTFAPKFEENFNPDKKSYDVNRERQEVNKMKAQIKKEKKLALKDIRKQTKFVARQQIVEKKQMYLDYHRKMANIVNSISTVEGAEKNQYEREKKRRQNQR